MPASIPPSALTELQALRLPAGRARASQERTWRALSPSAREW